MSISVIAEKLFDLEKMFRELAADLQLGRKTWLDVPEVLSRASAIVSEIKQEIAKIKSGVITEPDDVAVASAIEGIVDQVEEMIRHLAAERIKCMRQGTAPAACKVDYYPVHKLETLVVDVIGHGCAFKARDTYTSYLNDLAACVHRVAEFTTSAIEHLDRITDKCVGTRNRTERAEKFCVIWSRAADYLQQNNKLYMDIDYEALRGWVVGDRVYLRLGDQEGHRAEIDFSRGTVKYYDDDAEVNKTLARLLQDVAGLNCRVHDYGIECSGLTEENAEKVAKVLAFATSMDFRIYEIDKLIERAAREIKTVVKSLGLELKI